MSMRALAAVVAAFLLLLAPGVRAAEDPTAEHRRVYAQVNDGLERMARETFDLEMPDAPLPSAVTVWKEDGTPRKVRVVYPGDHGDTVQEFYYSPVTEGMKLLFVFEAITTQAVDGSRASTRENRYYFQDDALFRWLDHAKQPVPAGSDDFRAAGRDLMATSDRVFARIFGEDTAAEPATDLGPPEEMRGRFAGVEEGDYLYLLLAVGEETHTFMVLQTERSLDRLLAAPEEFIGRSMVVTFQRAMETIPEAGGRIEVQKALKVAFPK